MVNRIRRTGGLVSALLLGVGAAGLLWPRSDASIAADARAPEVDRGARLERSRDAQCGLPRTPRAPGVEISMSTSEAIQRARQLVGQISSQLRQLLAQDPLYRQYQDCAKTGAKCSRLYADALFSALGPVDADIVSGKIALGGLAGSSEAIHELVADICASSADDLERIAALKIIQFAPGLEPHALPPEAYGDLIAKNDVEVQLLLQRNVQLPLDDARVIDATQAIALSPTHEARVKVEAIRALGHRETAAQLSATLAELMTSERLPAYLVENGVPLALGNCGQACLDTFEALALSADPELRGAAYLALKHVAADQAMPIRQRVSELLEQNEQATESDRAQIASLEETDQSDLSSADRTVERNAGNEDAHRPLLFGSDHHDARSVGGMSSNVRQDHDRQL